jgi:hypothetical protein
LTARLVTHAIKPTISKPVIPKIGPGRLLLQEQRTAEAGGGFKKAQGLYEQLSREDPNNQRLIRESASLASFAGSISDIR